MSSVVSGCRNASRATGSPCQRDGVDERDLLLEQPRRPGVVVGAAPAVAAEQHDRQLGFADQLEVGERARSASAAARAVASTRSIASRYASEPWTASENHSGEPACAAGELVRVVGRVPLVGSSWITSRYDASCVCTARASVGIAVEQRRAVERREQPLVRVDHERVGVLDAVELVRGRSARGARRRRTRRRRASRGHGRGTPPRCRRGRRRGRRWSCPRWRRPRTPTPGRRRRRARPRASRRSSGRRSVTTTSGRRR